MKNLIINLIVFSLLLLGVLFLLDKLYTNAALAKSVNKVIWAFNKKNEHYDFAVVGNSRVLNMVDTRAIDNYSHLSGINLGILGALPVENAILLSRFLSVNKLNTVFLQLDSRITWAIASSENRKLPFFETSSYMPYIKDTDVYPIVSQYTSPVKYIPWRYIPFARYAEFNNVYSLNRIFEKYIEQWDKTGYELSRRKSAKAILTDSAELIGVTTDIDSFADINLAWAQKIVDLCKAQKIQVVLFTSPVHETALQYPATTYSINRIKVFSSKNHIRYWNWSALFANYPDSVYSDAFHTNCYAADDFAKTFSDSIITLSKNK